MFIMELKTQIRELLTTSLPLTLVNGEVTFDISPFIQRGFISRERISPYRTRKRMYWVTTEIDKDTGSGFQDRFSTYEATQLACYGYTTPDEGVNYTTYIDNDVFDDFNGSKTLSGYKQCSNFTR